MIDNNDSSALSVTALTSTNTFVEGDVVSIGTSAGVVAVSSGTVLQACSACGGSGLEGGSGISGLITAVFNGSAIWAGANIDIYGAVLS